MLFLNAMAILLWFAQRTTAVIPIVQPLIFNSALQGHSLLTIRFVSLFNCQKACQARSLCKAISFRRLTHTCVLSNVDTSTSGVVLSKVKGYVYSEKRNWSQQELLPGCDSTCSGAAVCIKNMSGLACIITECPVPPNLDANSYILGTEQTTGATVKYVCKNNTTLSQLSTCRQNGHWTLTTFTCPNQSGDTSKLGCPASCTQEQWGQYMGSAGTGCSKYCHCTPLSMHADGSTDFYWQEMPCGAGTLWNNTMQSCDHAHNVKCGGKIGTNCCGPPPTLDPYSHTNAGSDVSVGDVITYTCDDDPQITAQSTCISASTWSRNSFTCPVRCRSFPKVCGGEFTTANGNAINAIGTVTCKGTYAYSSVTTVTCLSNGQWSSTQIECISPAGQELNGKTYFIVNAATHEFWNCNEAGTKLISTRLQPVDNYSRFSFTLLSDGSFTIRVNATGYAVYDGYGVVGAISNKLNTLEFPNNDHTRYIVTPEGKSYRIRTKATGRLVRMDTDTFVSSRYDMLDAYSLYKFKTTLNSG